MREVLSILLVEDDEVDRFAVRRTLFKSGADVDLEEVESVRAAVDALRAHHYDCALLDFHLPDGTAFDVLRLAGMADRRTPIIVLTGEAEGNHTYDLMSAGAEDYIVKSKATGERLMHAIRYAIARNRSPSRRMDPIQRIAAPPANPVVVVTALPPPIIAPAPQVSTTQTASGPVPVSDGAYRVLIVDRDAAVRDATLHSVETAGFEARSAADPAASEAIAERFLPDIMIVDLDLADFDPSELMRRVRAKVPSRVPVLFLASGDPRQLRHRLRTVTQSRLLIKPVVRKAMIDALEELLYEKETPEAKDEKRSKAMWYDEFGGKIRDYCLEKRIGQGAMGVVFLGTHVNLDRQVAIKILPPLLSQDKACIERFRREAKALATLDHPNIVPVYDLFEHSGCFCIVMGFAAGGSLGDLVENRERLDEKQAARYIRDAALGLDAAARKNIVHRDVKPDNLLITDDDRIRVADFGLAKFSGERTHLTQTGFVMGTPAYMAPEQWDDRREPDTRSDLYALGCTLFHLVIGDVPFPSASSAAVMRHHILDTPPRLHRLRSDLTNTLSQIVHKLLAKDPDDRFQSGTELVEALEPCIEGKAR